MAGKGLFIVIEGIDGSGKSTQVFKLAEWIISNFKKINTVVLTHEPTQGKYGKEIYQRLHQGNVDSTAVAKERMLELYVLDREEHVNEVIAPNLTVGSTVVCDRYKYSTIAYQSAQGVPIAHAIEENAGFPIPDLVLFLNASPENCVARMEKAGKKMDKFEKMAFLEKVKAQFLQAQKLLPKEPFHVINANQSIELIHADVVKAVRPLVEEKMK